MKNDTGETAMHTAALNGNIEVVKLLLPREAKLKDSEGRTAMMGAAESGHLEIVRLLIPQEAEMVDGSGKTALIHAIEAGQVEVAKELLPHEGEIPGSNGVMPVEHAFRTDSIELHGLFEKDITKELSAVLQAAYKTQCGCGGKAKSLDKAAETGCVRCSARFFREAGRAVNGATALIRAAEKGHLEVVKLLVPHEAKMQKNGGWTALMFSAGNGHLEIAKLLIPHEAKMQRKDGETALIWAIKNNKLEVAQLLLPIEGGIADKVGKTPAEYAKHASPEIRALFAEPQPAPSIAVFSKLQHVVSAFQPEQLKAQ